MYEESEVHLRGITRRGQAGDLFGLVANGCSDISFVREKRTSG